MTEFFWNKDAAETLSYWATTVGIVIAVVGGIGAYLKYRADERAREWDRARQSYGSFIDLGIANREFYPGCWTHVAPHDPAFENGYLWFMARFLWASEEVLANPPHREAALWRGGIKGVIIEHVDYFRSSNAQAELLCYSPHIIELVREAIVDADAMDTASPLTSLISATAEGETELPLPERSNAPDSG